jgi:hypothetical protein
MPSSASVFDKSSVPNRTWIPYNALKKLLRTEFSFTRWAGSPPFDDDPSVFNDICASRRQTVEIPTRLLQFFDEPTRATGVGFLPTETGIDLPGALASSDQTDRSQHHCDTASHHQRRDKPSLMALFTGTVAEGATRMTPTPFSISISVPNGFE